MPTATWYWRHQGKHQALKHWWTVLDSCQEEAAWSASVVVITLPIKVCIVKAMVFPVVMYECESWTVKKTEHQRIDAFELQCWRRLLRVTWVQVNPKRNQSVLKKSVLNIHWKDWCWSWSYNTLATQCEEPPHWKATVMLGKTEVKRRSGEQRMIWLDSITDSMDMNLSNLWETGEDRGAWYTTVHGVAKSWTRLSD